MKHARAISRFVRLSGSDEESRSLDYVREQLEESGFEVSKHTFDSYVGLPESAHLAVLSPKKSYSGTAPALSKSTPAAGLRAELVYLGQGEAYDGVDVHGKVALIEGLSNPRIAKLAEKNGTIAQVFINDSHAHEGTTSVVWGTPTPETASELPQTPSINVTRREGEELRELLRKGLVEVVLRTRVNNRWRKVPVLVGDLEAGEDFVLLSGHIDSWHYGAMDNAAGNALMLEVGRVLSRYQEMLRRGLRLAFWSGHSHGRYSGSTWYVDNFWGELYGRCVAHVNVDSVGAMGATDLSHQQVMREAEEFVVTAVREVTGEEALGVRLSRAGDQSFWGVGITSMLCEPSGNPKTRGGESDLTPWGWWWHTEGDTLDKIDKEFLLRDAKIYLVVVGGLCARRLLPYRFEPTTKEIEDTLRKYARISRGRLDLAEVVREAYMLRIQVRRLDEEILKLNNRDDDTRIANEALKKLGRILIPVNYTKVGRFDQDLAVPIPPIPGLEPVSTLAELKPGSNEYRFLATRLRREANRVLHALLEARRLTEVVLQEMDEKVRSGGRKKANNRP